MLILARREGEKVRIGDDITITILSSKRGQVRVGIAAPIETPVHRDEVYNKIQRCRAYCEGENITR